MFIFSQEAGEIRAKARDAEREKCDKLYMALQNKQQSQYQADKEELQKTYERELKKQIKETKNHYDIEIKKLKAQLKELQTKVKMSQEAWELFRNNIPDLVNYASVLQTKTLTLAKARAKELALADDIEHHMMIINKKFVRITPNIDRLLAMDDVVEPVVDIKYLKDGED